MTMTCEIEAAHFRECEALREERNRAAVTGDFGSLNARLGALPDQAQDEQETNKTNENIK